jgi:hypothetical protein
MKSALINASVTALYIVAVSLFMYWGGSNKIGQRATVFIPIAFLMLFVFSAAFTGFFVFGKPTLMYLDGKKKEAVTLIGYTLTILFGYTILALVILLASSN